MNDAESLLPLAAYGVIVVSLGGYFIHRMFRPWARDIALRQWRQEMREKTGECHDDKFPPDWKPKSDDWERPDGKGTLDV